MKRVKIIIVLCLLISCRVIAQVEPLDTRFYEDALTTKNNQYESGVERVRSTYQYLMNLPLVNKYNLAKFKQYQDSATELINRPEWKGADYSLPQNVSTLCNALFQYKQDPYIKAEITILATIWNENEAMRQQNPGSFTSMDRYKELQRLIIELQDCQPSEIRNLGIRHGIF